ncbi:ribonuclease H-like domain-containing protein [Tanacetum coccineum]
MLLRFLRRLIWLVGCNSSQTPVDTESKLGDDALSLYMHDPREPHFSALKRILSAEAEYRGVANVLAKTCWLRNLLRELHTHLSFATLVYFNNVSAVYFSFNPVQHQRTKHVQIDIYFVRDLVAAGQNWSRRNLGAPISADLLDLLFEISSEEINEVEDTDVWSLGTDETFSVNDARCIIDSKILPSLAPLSVWDKNIPRNVNIFIWRLILDFLPHKLNLSSRSMDI